MIPIDEGITGNIDGNMENPNDTPMIPHNIPDIIAGGMLKKTHVYNCLLWIDIFFDICNRKYISFFLLYLIQMYV
jgi:hypothetical protein